MIMDEKQREQAIVETRRDHERIQENDHYCILIKEGTVEELPDGGFVSLETLALWEDDKDLPDELYFTEEPDEALRIELGRETAVKLMLSLLRDNDIEAVAYQVDGLDEE